ncbi:MAG: hypothetical protein ACOCP8_07600 [archaeon]
METRYTRPYPEKENKEILEKFKNEFKKEANKLHMNVMKLNSIIIGGETIYNPYKYKCHNKWVRLTQL